MTQLNWRPAEELKDVLNVDSSGYCVVPRGLITQLIKGDYFIYGNGLSGEEYYYGCSCCEDFYKFEQFKNVKRFAVLELE